MNFHEPSLEGMTKKRTVYDRVINLRALVLPEESEVFVTADFKSAELRQETDHCQWYLFKQF
jgi:hypothetical protein